MPRILPIVGLVLALRLGAIAQTSPPQPVLRLTLQDAFARARANGLQLLSADIAARIAREDRVQAGEGRRGRPYCRNWQGESPCGGREAPCIANSGNEARTPALNNSHPLHYRVAYRRGGLMATF